MNSYTHAMRSVEIFNGGDIDQYLPIHQTIDLQKAVTNSVYCRFQMHHFDLGGAMLTKIYGKNVPGTKVPVAHLLLQHLLEDYGYVPMYSDWLDAFPKGKEGFVLPKGDESVVPLVMQDISKLALRHSDTSLGQVIRVIGLVRKIVSCEDLTSSSEILANDKRSWLFASQTGLELLKRIMKPEDSKMDDLITSAMFHLFRSSEYQLQSIADIPAAEASWMRRPKAGHMEVSEVASLIEEFDKSGDLKNLPLLPSVKSEEKEEKSASSRTVDTPDYHRPNRDWSDPGRCSGGRMD